MDLFCPHCTRRVTVPDDKAGLVLNCPLCAKQFMAPSLAPAAPVVSAPPPPPAPPPPAPLPSYELSPAPTPPVTQAPTPRSKPEPPAAPPPPPPPGDYTRSFTLHLRGEYLPFVPTACLLMIFLLSFPSWHHAAVPLSMWGLAGEHNQFLTYTILLMLGIIVAILSVLFEKQILATPPQLAPFMMWKDLFVGLLLSIGLLLLAFDYGHCHFGQSPNPMMLAMKLAFRLHVLAVAASFLMFWVHWRKMKNAPPPKLEIKW